MKKEKILNAPGLVGEIATYINETSYKQQPILALAAAIVATGAIYGHRLQSITGLRTNIYILAIAESGTGKESPRVAIKVLFDNMGGEFQKMVSGDPASTAGLLGALEKSGGVSVFLIDEIGHYLRGINGKNAPSHLAGIMSLFTKLFTSADTTFRGLEYSTRAKDAKGRTDIEQPCACVLGSTTPGRIYGALSLDDIQDGFLPRWLALESNDNDPKDNSDMKKFRDSHGAYLVQRIPEIVAVADSKKTITMESGTTAIPVIVHPNDTARKMLDQFKAHANELRKKAIETESNMKYIYTRANELVQKLALIACELIDGEFVITESSATWAISVIEYSMNKMQSMIEKIASSPHEQAMDDMLAILNHRGKMTKAEFCNYCRKWILRERQALLDDLVAREKAICYKIGKKSYVEPVSDVENVKNV